MVKGMTLEEIIGVKQRRIDRINKVGERTGETYSENEIYILKYLEELKNLREKYKNVSEAYMKVNNVIFDSKQELNKVSQELNKVSQELNKVKQELEVYKGIIIRIYDELNKDKKEVINALVGSINPNFVEMFFKPRYEVCNCEISQEEVKNDLFEEGQK